MGDTAFTELRVALDRLHAVRDELDRLELSLREARTEAVKALRRASSEAAAAGEGLPRALARELYWRAQDLPVDEVARVFSVDACEVHKFAGSLTVNRPCRDCGAPVSIVMHSRTLLLRFRSRAAWTCDSCRDVRVAEERERLAAAAVAWRAEEAVLAREQQVRIAEVEARGDFEELTVRWHAAVGMWAAP